MSVSFRRSVLYAAILLGVPAAQTHAANVIVKGNLTINGETVTIEKAPEIAFGKEGDVVEITKKSGDSLFVSGGKLTVKGSSVHVVGADSAVRSQKMGQVWIGSALTDTLNLVGTNYGALSSSNSTVVLDAKHVELGLTEDWKTSTVAAALASSGTLLIGGSAETVNLKGLTNDNNTNHNAAGLYALSGGVATVGSDITKSVVIEGTHNEEAHGIYALGTTTGSATIEVHGSDILVAAGGNNYAEGVGAIHSGPVHVGDASTDKVTVRVESKGTKTVASKTS